jgi:DNA-binding PadR family transcriptional regulator
VNNTQAEEILSPLSYTLLALLKKGKMPGTELAQAYETRTLRKVTFGTLYTTLKRLETRKLIESSEGTDDRREKYYKLSKTGKEALKRSKDFYAELILL